MGARLFPLPMRKNILFTVHALVFSIDFQILEKFTLFREEYSRYAPNKSQANIRINQTAKVAKIFVLRMSFGGEKEISR